PYGARSDCDQLLHGMICAVSVQARSEIENLGVIRITTKQLVEHIASLGVLPQSRISLLQIQTNQSPHPFVWGMSKGWFQDSYSLLIVPELGKANTEHGLSIGDVGIQLECALEAFGGLGRPALGVIHHSQVGVHLGKAGGQSGQLLKGCRGPVQILCRECLVGFPRITLDLRFLSCLGSDSRANT